jgi:predicted component of type VI protein secretion system
VSLYVKVEEGAKKKKEILSRRNEDLFAFRCAQAVQACALYQNKEKAMANNFIALWLKFWLLVRSMTCHHLDHRHA